MTTGIIEIIKKAATDAVEAGKPCTVRYGTVKTINPLSIQITNNFILPESVLIVPQYLTDYQMDITLHDWATQNRAGGSGHPAFASHNHDIVGRKRITVHAGLQVGDKVVLLRQNGGQFFLVLDRIPKGESE